MSRKLVAPRYPAKCLKSEGKIKWAKFKGEKQNKNQNSEIKYCMNSEREKSANSENKSKTLFFSSNPNPHLSLYNQVLVAFSYFSFGLCFFTTPFKLICNLILQIEERVLKCLTIFKKAVWTLRSAEKWAIKINIEINVRKFKSCPFLTFRWDFKSIFQRHTTHFNWQKCLWK